MLTIVQMLFIHVYKHVKQLQYVGPLLLKSSVMITLQACYITIVHNLFIYHSMSNDYDQKIIELWPESHCP